MDNILSAEKSTISSQDLPYGYVYLTTNTVNNKKYIGAHESSCFDGNYKGSGKILWKAINKYGWDNFTTEVIKWCYTREELFEAEFKEIETRNAVKSTEYYNVMPGGHGGDNKTSLSPEEHDVFVRRVKESKNRPRTQKEIDHMKILHSAQEGRPHSEESKAKARKSNLGQKRSEEARRHMSERHADVSGDNNPFYGKHHSKESRSKISDNNARSHLGKVWITNKVDVELLVRREDLIKYPEYVRGRLRKSQRLKGR